MPAIAPSGGGMTMEAQPLAGVSAVAIEGRALLIEGPPGSGKSTLALALIYRGAHLIGDDGVTLERTGDTVMIAPPPNIAGLIEIRGVGLVTLPLAAPAPLALVLTLGSKGERLPATVPTQAWLGCEVPRLPFDPGTIAPALRAEWALAVHGREFASLRGMNPQTCAP